MKEVTLGKRDKKKTLIFDMDETLISAQFKSKLPKNFTTDFEFPSENGDICVCIRPFCHEVLEKLGEFYEILVFTAGEQEYADNVLNRVDPENKLFDQRFYRQDCIRLNNHFFVKDL